MPLDGGERRDVDFGHRRAVRRRQRNSRADGCGQRRSGACRPGEHRWPDLHRVAGRYRARAAKPDAARTDASAATCTATDATQPDATAATCADTDAAQPGATAAACADTDAAQPGATAAACADTDATARR